MKYYQKPVGEVMREFNSSHKGLSNSQIKLNKDKYGENKLPTPKKESWIKRFIYQLKDPLTLILIAAAVISIIADPHE